MKPSITVKFVDFWPTFDCLNNKFVDALSTQREVIVLTDNNSKVVPDILFYSRCGYGEHYKYDCLKIYFTGENDFPNFNECDYALSFYQSDCGGRNLRYPLYMLYEIEQASNPPILNDNQALNREFCSLVMSNSINCDPRRIEIIDAVESYSPLAYGGSFRNNVGGKVEDKIKFISNYRFNLALENSYVPGYVTEKILEPFAAATVPIYWGSNVAKSDFNPDSFINIEDYDSLDSFIKDLHNIATTPERYLNILRAHSFTSQTTLDIDSKLESFLNNIADNCKRYVIRYGEMGSYYSHNRIVQPLTRKYRFIKSSLKLLSSTCNNFKNFR